MVVEVKQKTPFKLDWQHVALAVLAVCGGIICLTIPAIAKFVGPVISAAVPLALAKKSPLSSSDAKSDDDKVTVINIGTPPHYLVVENSDIRIKWPDGQETIRRSSKVDP